MSIQFQGKFYCCCPTCRHRMRRVGINGDDIRSCIIDYQCPECGNHRKVFIRGPTQTLTEATAGQGLSGQFGHHQRPLQITALPQAAGGQYDERLTAR
jgi:hypothetical protein